MSLVDMINEDDDNHSISSSTNSDDDMDQSNCYNHRSCSRYAACNRKKHQHLSIDPVNLKSLSNSSKSLPNSSKLVKGMTRSCTNDPEHQQKFDGNKWRRICSISDCSVYLNGGVYYENWLCRKHYLLSISTNKSTGSDNLITKNTNTSQNPVTRLSNKNIKRHKRGDMMITDDGIRQKYNGKFWRPLCNYDNCTSFLVTRGYCHRHDKETRQKKPGLLSSVVDSQQQNVISKSSITQSFVQKPKKGDVQCVRQKWNGRKWYSLCRYSAQECSRRSRGMKSEYLCDIHYKEYLKKRRNLKSLSSNANQNETINNNSNIDKQNTIPCQIEQCIQTDITYPLESNDLQQGCFLIDDDTDDQYQSESSQLRVYIKKEEGNYLINKRKFSIDVNSLSTNCKLEITKLEH